MTTTQPERKARAASRPETEDAAAQQQTDGIASQRQTVNAAAQLPRLPDVSFEGKDSMFLDIDRMVNEGLGGGLVTSANGLIGDSNTDTIDVPESVQES